MNRHLAIPQIGQDSRSREPCPAAQLWPTRCAAATPARSVASNGPGQNTNRPTRPPPLPAQLTQSGSGVALAPSVETRCIGHSKANSAKHDLRFARRTPAASHRPQHGRVRAVNAIWIRKLGLRLAAGQFKKLLDVARVNGSIHRILRHVSP